MRFLHTADWQLGMRRHFLGDEARARFAQARFDAVVRLGEVAREEGCELLVVAGDVFESNQLERRTLLRALDALASIPVPVFLLPGNHDPLDSVSLYRSAAFRDGLSAKVRVLADSAPVEVRPGLELVGVPWTSKHPTVDRVEEVLGGLDPASGLIRIVVAHGRVDRLSPDRRDPARISLDAVERALAENRLHYLALGDRHSVTRLGDRAWYPGTPEVTDFDEERPGQVLVVELDGDRVQVEERSVGCWSFLRQHFELSGGEDLDRLEAWLEALPDKVRTVLRLGFAGTLSLAGKVRLDEILHAAGERFAAVDEWEERSDLAVLADRDDRQALELGGFARQALEELVAEARGTGEVEGDAVDGEGAKERARVAQDALALLYRLARGTQ
jgi:DNA repair exonuclease SbcCD nuclease subunit